MIDRTLVLWCPPDPTARGHRLLTAGDRERADCFRLTVDADRYLTARVLARRAGAAWLGIDATDVRVDVESEGRPFLVDGAGLPLAAHLSITHAGDLVGVAVAALPVGLDVQDVPALAHVLDSDLVWTATELADLARLAPTPRLTTAAAWWTAKEAVLKSLGRGLLERPEELEIRSSDVSWRSLEVAPGHAAALATAEAEALVATERRLAGINRPIRPD